MQQISEQIHKLIEELASPDNSIQLDAENALIRIGKPAVAQLINATRHPNPQARWRAAYALGIIGDNRAYSSILNLVTEFDDPASEVRYEAILALGELQDSRAVEPLIDILIQAQPGEPAPQWAASTLARIGRPAVRPLRRVLRQGTQEAKRLAISAIEDLSEWVYYNKQWRNYGRMTTGQRIRTRSDLGQKNHEYKNWHRRYIFYRLQRKKRNAGYYLGCYI